MEKKSKIYNLIKYNNLEWLMIVNKKNNYNLKKFFKIIHIVNYGDNVVIISDIESKNNKYYTITLHDCLYENNLIKINSESKIIEITTQQKITERNFINIINNKFNKNKEENIISPFSPFSPFSPKSILPPISKYKK